MSNVTISYTGNPLFPYLVSSYCMSLAEADRKKSAIIDIGHAGFIPNPTQAQTQILENTDPATLYRNAFNRALEQDRGEFGRLEHDEERGWHFTDGGQSSETMIFPDDPDNPLPPVAEALQSFQEDEPPFRNPDAPNGDGEA